MDYSPVNPWIWGSFLGFALFTWLTVRIYLARNPGYPGKRPEVSE